MHEEVRYVEAAANRQVVEAREAVPGVEGRAQRIVYDMRMHGQESYAIAAHNLDQGRRTASETVVLAEAEVMQARNALVEMCAQGEEYMIAERARVRARGEELMLAERERMRAQSEELLLAERSRTQSDARDAARRSQARWAEKERERAEEAMSHLESQLQVELRAKEQTWQGQMQELCLQRESEHSELRAMMSKMSALADAALARTAQFKDFVKDARIQHRTAEAKCAEVENELEKERRKSIALSRATERRSMRSSLSCARS